MMTDYTVEEKDKNVRVWRKEKEGWLKGISALDKSEEATIGSDGSSGKSLIFSRDSATAYWGSEVTHPSTDVRYGVIDEGGDLRKGVWRAD